MSINSRLTVSVERLFNVLLGLTIIFWTTKGTIEELYKLGTLTVVRVSIIIVNVIVAISFMRRRKVVKYAHIKEVAACFPSFIIGSISYRLSEQASVWPTFLQILFLIAAVLTATSFLFLGRNFAIFPALREITIKGPYQFVRHPAYLGELLLIFVFSLNSSPWSFLIFVLAIAGVVIRITIEEKLLLFDTHYHVYQNKVRWKMIYGIW